MKHLGDIMKINGAEAPVVDIITGGSPCQDLSVAGKRAGLAGERSGLFMEQIRIIKEMREHDRDMGHTGRYIRPRYMVWENVPGAFSSNGGEDFRAVLEETAKIAKPDAVIPRLEGGQKWRSAGCIMGDGWSVAWRVHDAQHWGVPQRRKRISLVADFGGDTAPEILFERPSVSGDTQPGGETRQETPRNATGGADGSSVGCDLYNLKITGDVGATLSATCGGGGTTGGQVLTFEPGAASRVGNHIYTDGVTGSLRANAGDNQQSVCILNDQGGGIMSVSEDRTGMLRANMKHHEPIVLDKQATTIFGKEQTPTLVAAISQKTGNTQDALAVITLEGNGQTDQAGMSDKVGALNCMHDQQAVMTYGLDRAAYNQGKNAQFGFSVEVEKIGAQTAKGPGAVCQAVDVRNGSEDEINGALQSSACHNTNSCNVCRTGATVRRLTPLECERLQGYPDGWTDIGEWVDSKGKRRKDSDGSRYKALGNSIALPFWDWLAGRITANYDRTTTMASLFDGIGGFPLTFSRHGCEAVWASEIEEFPIAVTKRRFGED